MIHFWLWLPFFIFTPLMSVSSILLVPVDDIDSESNIRNVALWGALVSLVLCVALFVAPAPAASSQASAFFGTMLLDDFSIYFILLSFLSALSVYSYSSPNFRFYIIILILVQLCSSGLFCSTHILSFYLFWSALFWLLFYLVVLWGSRPRVMWELIIRYIFNSVILLTAFSVMHMHTGSFALVSIARFPPDQQIVLFTCLGGLFLLRAPLWPFFSKRSFSGFPIAVLSLSSCLFWGVVVYGWYRLNLDAFCARTVEARLFLSLICFLNLGYCAQLIWRSRTLFDITRILIFLPSSILVWTLSLGLVQTSLAVLFDQALISGILGFFMSKYAIAPAPTEPLASPSWEKAGKTLLWGALFSLPGTTGFSSKFFLFRESLASPYLQNTPLFQGEAYVMPLLLSGVTLFYAIRYWRLSPRTFLRSSSWSDRLMVVLFGLVMLFVGCAPHIFFHKLQGWQTTPFSATRGAVYHAQL